MIQNRMIFFFKNDFMAIFASHILGCCFIPTFLLIYIVLYMCSFQPITNRV